LKEQIDELNKPAVNIEEENVPDKQQEDKIVEINEGDTLATDQMEIPDITDGLYTHYPADANITSIDPLQTLGVRFLIDCPQEVEESDRPLLLTFLVGNEEYNYTMR
jgi:hypothetical protein